MSEKTSSRTGRILVRIASAGLTLGFIGAAVALAGVGTTLIAANAERGPSEAEVSPVAVATVPLVWQESYELGVRYQGVVEAPRRVSRAFELGGTVSRVLVTEGDRVAAGDVLARLDTAALEADRAALVAAREALESQRDLAQLTADRQRALLDREFASQQRYDEARLAVSQLEAEIRRAEAGVAAVDVALSKSEIRAPFDAIVGERHLDDGATAGAGQAIVTLFEDTRPEFRVGLPEVAASRLASGDTAEIVISGVTHTATVTRIRPDIDPATRTVPVILTIETEAGLPQGALGTLDLARTVPGEGAWVPVTALAEGVRGLWTVYVVETTADGSVARREAVELIHAEEDRAFVRGAFADGANLVSNGTHRLADGQPVLPSEG